MLKTLLLTLVATLLFAAAASAQQIVGISQDGMVFMIDKVKRDKNTVTFIGSYSPAVEIDKQGKVTIDGDNIVFTDFWANCMSFDFTASGNRGLLKGVPFGPDKSAPTSGTAEKPQIMYSAIQAACKAAPTNQKLGAERR